MMQRLKQCLSTQKHWKCFQSPKQLERFRELWITWMIGLLIACFSSPYQLQWLGQGLSARISLSVDHKNKVHWLPPKPNQPKRPLVSSRLLQSPQYAATQHILRTQLFIALAGGPFIFFLLSVRSLQKPMQQVTAPSTEDSTNNLPSVTVQPVRQRTLLKKQCASRAPMVFSKTVTNLAAVLPADPISSQSEQAVDKRG